MYQHKACDQRATTTRTGLHVVSSNIYQAIELLFVQSVAVKDITRTNSQANFILARTIP